MPTNERKTIQDIAESANVSKSTVSRVLTGSTHVTGDKREAVLRVMEELQYQPNLFARGLASRRSFTIGVLTQNFGSPFYDAILRGIIQGLLGTDYSPIFADGGWQSEIEQRALRTLAGRHADGLIVVGGLSEGKVLARFSGERPMIVVGRKVPELAGHCVAIDNFAAAYSATQHLINAGHQQIVHITGDMLHQDAAEREAGYEQALQDAGIAFNPELVIEGNFRRQSGLMGIEMLFTRGRNFSAIFASNDQMAVGARLALYRRGIRVPDDISIVGFDDQPDSAYMIPPLTTVRQPAVAMGETAAKAILDMLDGKPVVLSPLSTELIARESVARFR